MINFTSTILLALMLTTAFALCFNALKDLQQGKYYINNIDELSNQILKNTNEHHDEEKIQKAIIFANNIAKTKLKLGMALFILSSAFYSIFIK